MNVDHDATPALIAGLTQACRTSPDILADMDLCSQLPNAPTWLFLPAVHNVPNCNKRSTISIPFCHACLWEHERKGTTPYWKTEWALALVTRCPEHLVLLSEYCRHCLLGLLTVVAHPRDGSIVARCTVCFRTVSFRSAVAAPPGASPRQQLVASMGQSLVSACRGLSPDPVWLGPIDPSTFPSVITDLLWIFMDGNLDFGSPLIEQYAPASEMEMQGISRSVCRRPLSLLSVRHREIVAAALAVALLGSRLTERFDLGTRLPVPVGELDSCPFSAAFRPIMRHRLGEMPNRIRRWPPVLKNRALRHLTSAH